MAAKSSLLPLLLGGGALLLLMSRGGGKGRATGKGPAYSPDPLGSTGGSKPEPSDIPVIAEGLENAREASEDAREIVEQADATQGASANDHRWVAINGYVLAMNAAHSMAADLASLRVLAAGLRSSEPVPHWANMTVEEWVAQRQRMLNDVEDQILNNDLALPGVVAVTQHASASVLMLRPLTTHEQVVLTNAGYPNAAPALQLV